jgi:hypothetical protein
MAFLGFDTHSLGWSDNRHEFRAEAAFLALHVAGADAREEDEFPELEEDTELTVVIHAVFRLSYEVPESDEVSEEDLEHFSFANGTLHAWPYWRELAQSMTTRMGITPLIVGTYKIPSVHDE